MLISCASCVALLWIVLRKNDVKRKKFTVLVWFCLCTYETWTVRRNCGSWSILWNRSRTVEKSAQMDLLVTHSCDRFVYKVVRNVHPGDWIWHLVDLLGMSVWFLKKTIFRKILIYIWVTARKPRPKYIDSCSIFLYVIEEGIWWILTQADLKNIDFLKLYKQSTEHQKYADFDNPGRNLPIFRQGLIRSSWNFVQT